MNTSFIFLISLLTDSLSEATKLSTFESTPNRVFIYSVNIGLEAILLPNSVFISPLSLSDCDSFLLEAKSFPDTRLLIFKAIASNISFKIPSILINIFLIVFLSAPVTSKALVINFCLDVLACAVICPEEPVRYAENAIAKLSDTFMLLMLTSPNILTNKSDSFLERLF